MRFSTRIGKTSLGKVGPWSVERRAARDSLYAPRASEPQPALTQYDESTSLSSGRFIGRAYQDDGRPYGRRHSNSNECAFCGLQRLGGF